MHCLLVENNPLTLFGIKCLMHQQFHHWKISTAESYFSALSTIKTENIDVLIVNIQLPDGNGLDLIRTYSTVDFRTPACLIISSNLPDDLNDPVFVSRRVRFVSKDAGLQKIVSVVNSLTADVSEASINIVTESRLFSGTGHSIRLTNRQRQIASLVAAGYSNKRIASTLSLSYGTVKNYMFDLMRLADVNSRIELLVKIQTEKIDISVKISAVFMCLIPFWNCIELVKTV